MRHRLMTTTALVATFALGSAATADDDDGREQGHEQRGADAAVYAPSQRVWIAGHYENRETSRVIPAITRQQWLPQRYEEVVIPAVTERVCIPAVTERVYCPEVTERVFLPEIRERVWVPARWDTRTDQYGRRFSVWMGSHCETRVVREGRYETRVISDAHYETRVVRPEAWEVRIVQPERRETRVIEQGHFVTVVVRPERRDVTVERVWVPGHWEARAATPAAWIPPGHRK